jgi:DNA mismatch endonuclease (patch repair protein)
LLHRIEARPIPAVPHTADIVFTRARLAVFIYEGWWHGCADHYRAAVRNSSCWAGKVARNRDHDRAVDDMLLAVGWRVVRVWEHEPRESVAWLIELAVRGTGTWGG